jgi:hypothetical protein
MQPNNRSKAQESRAAIERIYIIMRHLFIRGNYKPMGVSGHSLVQALLTLSPEIYGSMADEEHAELDGLLYVMERLPKGIEECRYINMISREGLENADFPVLIPKKRRRNCYRIDDDQMYIELTRGRSDIYDILTHLTFLYIQAEKIRNKALDPKGKKTYAWKRIENLLEKEDSGEEINEEVAFAYLSTLLGRTFDEVEHAYRKFESGNQNNLLHIVYWLGKLSIDEYRNQADRQIAFSSTLRERVGHHFYGEQWADNIKRFLRKHNFLDRPLHIISANLHSVMNVLFAKAALGKEAKDLDIASIARMLSKEENNDKQQKVRKYAFANGMTEIPDTSGTNLSVQIIDTAQIDLDSLPKAIYQHNGNLSHPPVIIVMDYAFGEQAFETMDELLKPYEKAGQERNIRVDSISIMGKAGILSGGKGDIMVPTAHIFEGTADNYPLDNGFSKDDFDGNGLQVFEGPMITVLGTSLQNRDVLKYFFTSSWQAIGLEMEGAHYQKAIQSAARIRKSINEDVKVRYAYYASDNPLVTGATLASGSLGEEGVWPTYLITSKILKSIFI